MPSFVLSVAMTKHWTSHCHSFEAIRSAFGLALQHPSAFWIPVSGTMRNPSSMSSSRATAKIPVFEALAVIFGYGTKGREHLEVPLLLDDAKDTKKWLDIAPSMHTLLFSEKVGSTRR